MRFIYLALGLFAWAQAHAGSLDVSFGTGVPEDGNSQTLNQPFGASRANGGEHFVLKFGTAKTITNIKISSFSASGLGKNLIRSVSGVNGKKSSSLPELFQFKSVTIGNPVDYKGLALLPNGSFVEASPNQSFNSLDVNIEGFANDDTSFLLQVSTAEDLAIEQFLLTRTGPHKDLVLGELLDESAFAKFSPAQLANLMKRGSAPDAAALFDKTYLCSTYSKLDGTTVDQKSRRYYQGASGELLSESNFEGSDILWSSSQNSFATAIPMQNGCGAFTIQNMVRQTPNGNLISELVVDLESYVSLCESAGYDPSGTRALEMNTTFPSVLDSKYVVGVYEYCRLSN